MEALDGFDEVLRKEYLNSKNAPKELLRRWDDLTAASRDADEEAGDLHSAMKGFIWTYKWEESGRKIIPELECEEGGRVTDVKAGTEYYEAETLYGVGDPISKLTRKIRNYTKSEKVRFVLRNSDILRHLREIAHFRNYWLKKNYDLEVYGMNLESRKLMPLDEFVTKLREIFEKPTEKPPESEAL